MFTSLELGKDEKELNAGGLSLKKNPLLVSIIDGCETLKALVEKQQLKAEDIAGAKALIMMRTDKVRRLWVPCGHVGKQLMVNKSCCCRCLQAADAGSRPLMQAIWLTSFLVHGLQIGFGISVTQGYGLVITRQPNMASGW